MPPVAIAEHIGGTVEAFCALMTARAAELGATNTRFSTPHGLPAENHYTTARDLAHIAAAAMGHPVFRQIVSTRRASIPWQGHDELRVLNNKNALLSSYEGATGIKTGYTRAAGRCLVFGAQRGEMELVGVVLNCPDWFDEAARLMDLCFARYPWTQAKEDGAAMGTLPVDGGTAAQASVRLLGALGAPLAEGETAQLVMDLPESVTPRSPPARRWAGRCSSWTAKRWPAGRGAGRGGGKGAFRLGTGGGRLADGCAERPRNHGKERYQ